MSRGWNPCTQRTVSKRGVDCPFGTQFTPENNQSLHHEMDRIGQIRYLIGKVHRPPLRPRKCDVRIELSFFPRDPHLFSLVLEPPLEFRQDSCFTTYPKPHDSCPITSWPTAHLLCAQPEGVGLSSHFSHSIEDTRNTPRLYVTKEFQGQMKVFRGNPSEVSCDRLQARLCQFHYPANGSRGLNGHEHSDIWVRFTHSIPPMCRAKSGCHKHLPRHRQPPHPIPPAAIPTDEQEAA